MAGEPRGSFWEHVDELRRRLLAAFLAVGAGTVFCFTFGFRSMSLGGLTLPVPVPSLTDTVATGALRKMVSDLVPPGTVTLIVTGPFEAVSVSLQVSLFLGTAIGMPVVVYEFWRFVSPALKPNERGKLLRYVVPATGLFVLGNLFAYVAILPFVLAFLYAYVFPPVQPFLGLQSFVDAVTFFSLAFGLTFELPMVMAVLTRLGVASAGFWTRNWRTAVLGIILFSAIITPDGTGVTMALVAAPMGALYALGALFAARIERRRTRATERKDI
ncbi:MAG: twin-arginine translocase subunit TatC [Euryarchaeota archaeon]|nr:twin-arginine translocase subunit TatC [Euryarchaeota archaeon]